MATEPTTRAWRVVLEKIEGDLLAGRILPGGHLPSERDLATQLGVGRSSVREALRVLEVMGLIRTATGSGPSSGAVVVAQPEGGLSVLLRLHVAAHGFPVADVIRTRVVLESAVVEALATQQDAALDGALAVLDAMDADDISRDEFIACDAQFHLALADAAGNPIIAATMGALRHAIGAYITSSAAEIDDWDATAERLRAEHRAIIAALTHRDAVAAREAVRDHIIGYATQAGLTGA